MISFNEKKCSGCGVCVRDCPVGALSLRKGKPIIESDKCTQCGLCARVCEYEAVIIDRTIPPSAVQCDACPVNCKINPGYLGACHRYRNDHGNLVRITPLHTYEDVKQVVGPEPPSHIRYPLVTGIGAGTAYPDCKPAPVIVHGKKGKVDVVTVVTEAPLSYSSMMVKIDTDMNIGEEGADVLVGKTKVGMVITEQYGSKMLSLGGVNLLTGSGGVIAAKTIADMANGKRIRLKVKKGAQLELQVGMPPVIDGEQPTSMRVGCGSATMGLFAPILKDAADEVIVLDTHFTSMLSQHPAGRHAGARPTGLRLKFEMSTPGRYFGDKGQGWGGTSIVNPLDVIADIDNSVAWPGMRILITETTGQKAAMFELQQDGQLKEIPLSAPAKDAVEAISNTCESSNVSCIYMGGTGGSARAGVVKYPLKLTEAVHNARAALTAGGAPVFLLPGGGINFMVDVARVKQGAFYWTPTPAIICPVEYTMELGEYKAMGGHVEAMKPFTVREPLDILD